MNHPRNRFYRKRLDRRGATLIDVATGSMLLAVLLIPSIHLITESRSCHRRLDTRDTVIFEAEKLLESTKVALSDPPAFDAAFASPVDVTNSITISDGPSLTSRLRIGRDASLPGARLLTIVTDVWHDADRNGRLDGSEISQTLRTQWTSP